MDSVPAIYDSCSFIFINTGIFCSGVPNINVVYMLFSIKLFIIFSFVNKGNFLSNSIVTSVWINGINIMRI